MKVLRSTTDLRLNITQDTDFRTDLGWEENFQEFEDVTLRTIINPVDNYETIRYIHKPYTSTITNGVQPDIWYYFYFLDGNNGYTKGLDYSLVGLTNQDNALMLTYTEKSFFRLEFYTTPHREDQKLVYAKSLSLPIGQRVYHATLNEYIHIPVFTGNNYKGAENMYLFWFVDGSVYTGTTLYMKARFFDGKDGSIVPFANKAKSPSDVFDVVNDFYYQLVFDKTDYSYQIFVYDGTNNTGNRIGQTGNPINFYQLRNG
jgi:hypothetical protein